MSVIAALILPEEIFDALHECHKPCKGAQDMIKGSIEGPNEGCTG